VRTVGRWARGGRVGGLGVGGELWKLLLRVWG
jgi:hypothetical protein